jgi:hypothetical protein
MKALKILPLLALLSVAACGGSEPAAPVEAPATPEAAPAAAEPGETAAPVTAPAGSFDWDKWAAVVNENPCNWLPAEELSALGIPGAGTQETTATETRCLWTDADGAQIFSAGVQTWDSAANLAAERAEQIKLAGEMGGFSLVGETNGTVTAVYRRDRGRLSVFPNADNETAMILINAQKTMRDDEAAKASKDERAKAFALKLMETYGL